MQKEDFITWRNISSPSFNEWLFFSLSSDYQSQHPDKRRPPELKWGSGFVGRRETFTLEHRPGQTRLILSGLLGNRQGAWSNLLNSASSVALFLFLCLSRLLTFSLRGAAAASFPIWRYLSHPLKALISHPPSPPPLFLSLPPSRSLSVGVCVPLRLQPVCPLGLPPPHISHQSVSTSLRQARHSVGYWAWKHTHTHDKCVTSCAFVLDP